MKKNTLLSKLQCLGWIFLCGLLPLRSFAVTYDLPSAGNTLVGHLQYTQSHYNDSVAVLAQQYDVGLNALIDANPGVDPLRRLGSGVFLTIPTQYLLPDEHHGIVVNLPEMRLYYFPTNANIVMTYPIGVGKIGKSVPVTRTAVARKTTDPTWIPPEDIREFNREQGIELPKVMPPGPDNPLGHYAIYLKLPTYLIHSTIFPDSVGKRASFGCVRMHEADVKELFSLVDRGLPVSIVNIPVKAGWNNNRLYLEAHPALEEFPTTTNSLVGMVNLVGNTVQKQSQLVLIDWQLVAFLHEERDGMPHEVGMVV